jgi:hypothetical protein
MENYVLSSLTALNMCSIKIPLEILKQIDKYQRHWRGGDMNVKWLPLAAWKMVIRPTLRGGL